MAKKKTKLIEFTKEQTDEIIPKLQECLDDYLETDVSQMKASFILDFITEELGPYYYNQGVLDATAFMTEKVDDMSLLLKTNV